MATNNQRIVAEALRLARTFNFETGFRFLCDNASPKMASNGGPGRAWFTNKCREHKIQT